jgi:serine/threonine-protein kinase RsbW
MNSRESHPQGTWRLRGRSAVADATLAARTFSFDEGLADDDLARLCIIVEELVANLFDHGGLTDLDPIGLSLASTPQGVRLVLVDPGTPFDPRIVDPRQKRPVRGGGAGIDLVRSWAQFVDYGMHEDGNRLELLIPCRPARAI